jgi:hypothetical protein
MLDDDQRDSTYVPTGSVDRSDEATSAERLSLPRAALAALLVRIDWMLVQLARWCRRVATHPRLRRCTARPEPVRMALAVSLLCGLGLLVAIDRAGSGARATDGTPAALLSADEPDPQTPDPALADPGADAGEATLRTAAGAGPVDATAAGVAEPSGAHPVETASAAVVEAVEQTEHQSEQPEAPEEQPEEQPVPVPDRITPVAGLSQVQMDNATAIVRAGHELGIPRRGLIVGVATAMQESTLLNLASEVLPESKNYPHQGTGWDHDSVGLFQQRTSSGWGPVASLMDPTYAATKFFQALQRVSGWEQMPLAQAAQAVQVSAYPEHYAKHEAAATEVVDAILPALQG